MFDVEQALVTVIFPQLVWWGPAGGRLALFTAWFGLGQDFDLLLSDRGDWACRIAQSCRCEAREIRGWTAAFPSAATTYPPLQALLRRCTIAAAVAGFISLEKAVQFATRCAQADFLLMVRSSYGLCEGIIGNQRVSPVVGIGGVSSAQVFDALMCTPPMNLWRDVRWFVVDVTGWRERIRAMLSSTVISQVILEGFVHSAASVLPTFRRRDSGAQLVNRRAQEQRERCAARGRQREAQGLQQNTVWAQFGIVPVPSS